MNILVCNRGSSTLKSSLFVLPDGTLPSSAPAPEWEARLDWTGSPEGVHLQALGAGSKVDTLLEKTEDSALVARMLETLWSGTTQVLEHTRDINAVGHRVVHGGADYSQRVRITPEVKRAVARLSRFARVHNPANLQGIEAVEAVLGAAVPQFAVFDTAFHSHLALPVSVYPGPYAWFERGIRRYGFHGTSHRYCARRAAELLGRSEKGLRLVICHLGSGCSLAAVADGRSVDTTMGFTPLEGLMMGTRSGSLDPGILIHLLREEGMSPEDLDELLNTRSGLLGISGVSSDMRAVLDARDQGNSRAALAVDMFVHRLRAAIGQMLASLGGADALVFTAGIGENCEYIRARACEDFLFLGMCLDPGRNARDPADEDIATPESRMRILVIRTQENWEIARECHRYLRPAH
jgi:acetate kinase